MAILLPKICHDIFRGENIGHRTAWPFMWHKIMLNYSITLKYVPEDLINNNCNLWSILNIGINYLSGPNVNLSIGVCRWGDLNSLKLFSLLIAWSYSKFNPYNKILFSLFKQSVKFFESNYILWVVQQISPNTAAKFNSYISWISTKVQKLLANVESRKFSLFEGALWQKRPIQLKKLSNALPAAENCSFFAMENYT